MNHDGEKSEGNDCDGDKYLMSPILGPGKVIWSSCSSRELELFLSGKTSKTWNQAECLKDSPLDTHMTFDYLKNDASPGDQFNSVKQCQHAFDSNFFPYVDEWPYEDICRELWCSNGTHAMRAHPALDGTGCSEKPFGYGSICKEGSCVPFNPDLGEPKDESEDDGTNDNGVDKDPDFNEDDDVIDNAIDENDNILWLEQKNRPVWYDKLFAQIFNDLDQKISDHYARRQEEL